MHELQWKIGADIRNSVFSLIQYGNFEETSPFFWRRSERTEGDSRKIWRKNIQYCYKPGISYKFLFGVHCFGHQILDIVYFVINYLTLFLICCCTEISVWLSAKDFIEDAYDGINVQY